MSFPREALADRSLARRYQEARHASLELVSPLSEEDCAIQSMPDASPAKWHLAHTSWYFETFILESFIPNYSPFNESYRVVFNSYYNSVGAQLPRPERGLLSRPSLREVMAYREKVDGEVLTWLESGRPTDEELQVLELGIQHEQQHQELLLMDVKHLLASNPLAPSYRELPEPSTLGIKPLHWVPHAGGVREIGHAGGGFAFDNERPRHAVLLRPFELASRLVACADFQGFIEDAGYARPELWLSDGWAQVQREKWTAPLYWERRDNQWWQRTLGGRRPVAADQPVTHVSYFEADAFARWMGARLPDEAEWEVFASDHPREGNFLESGSLHPVAPDAASLAEAPIQLFGDVWEWTRSSYSPYPGYELPTGPLGEYNGKFMCNQLSLRGGSCVTPRDHIRSTYRNFFYPHQRWQFSGIRLARD